MAPTFFNSWQLWEKMTFILACAIVVTCFAGLIRLAYIRWKLRKYNKIMTQNELQMKPKAELPAIPVSSLEPIPRGRAPFGIRAIESGIEVDGIWISRPNSPAPSTRGSSTAPLLNQPQLCSTNHLGPSRPQSLPASARTSRSTLDILGASVPNVAPVASRSLLNLPQDRISAGSVAEPGRPLSGLNLQGQLESHDCNPNGIHKGRAASGLADIITQNVPNSSYIEDGKLNTIRLADRNAIFSTELCKTDPDISMLERRRLAHAASSGQLILRSPPPSDASKFPSTPLSTTDDDKKSDSIILLNELQMEANSYASDDHASATAHRGNKVIAELSSGGFRRSGLLYGSIQSFSSGKPSSENHGKVEEVEKKARHKYRKLQKKHDPNS